MLSCILSVYVFLNGLTLRFKSKLRTIQPQTMGNFKSSQSEPQFYCFLQNVYTYSTHQKKRPIGDLQYKTSLNTIMYNNGKSNLHKKLSTSVKFNSLQVKTVHTIIRTMRKQHIKLDRAWRKLNGTFLFVGTVLALLSLYNLFSNTNEPTVLPNARKSNYVYWCHCGFSCR